MAESIRSFVARRNIRHYEQVLDATTDRKARATIEQLLSEARDELGLAEAEDRFSQGSGLGDLATMARFWRLKAAEHRETADGTQHRLAAATYRRLAHDYERLADRAEAKLDRRSATATTPAIDPI